MRRGNVRIEIALGIGEVGGSLHQLDNMVVKCVSILYRAWED